MNGINEHAGGVAVERFQGGFILADYRTSGRARYRGKGRTWVSAPIHVLDIFGKDQEADAIAAKHEVAK